MRSSQRLFLIAAAMLGFCGGLANTARADVEGRLPLAHIRPIEFQHCAYVGEESDQLVA
jgi:hypothetical protein